MLTQSPPSFAGRGFRSLSVGIVLAMCAGLLVPALIGGFVLTTLRQEQLTRQMEDELKERLDLLAIALVDPVWNVDTKAARTIADALLLDAQVVRIIVRDPQGEAFLVRTQPERRMGQARVARRPLGLNGARVGEVELELDDGLMQREYRRDRQVFVQVLLGQFGLALGLIMFSVRRRVLAPLARLTAFSNQLAGGNLDRPLDWSRPDEIGHLARQLDHMRGRLRTSFAEQQAILENVQVGVIFVRERIIRLANRQAEQIFGYGAGAMRGHRSDILYLSTAQFDEVGVQAYTAIAAPGGVFEAELRLKRLDGRIFWARMRGCALDPLAPQDGSIWVFEDITERRLASDQMRLSATVFENTADGVVITDRHQTIVAVNRSFQRITGYTEAEVLGKTPALFKSGRHEPGFYTAMWRSLAQKQRWDGEVWNRRKTGEVFPEHLAITAVFDQHGELDHYVGVFSDITFRKEAEDEIAHLAFYDPLTQLPNRRLLLDRLGRALNSSARHQREGALMLLDLDNFKLLNDTLGHDVGDQLLVGVASRLQSSVRQGDTVARLGGDEFVILLEELGGTGLAAMQAENVAQKVLSELNRPFTLDLKAGGELVSQRSHNCTCSLGITLFREHDATAEELMKRADTAMYQAKAAGRNTLRFFDPDMQAAVAARAAMEVDLRQALVEDQLVLFFQAQVDLHGRVAGAEALVRWQHPQLGMISPIAFIPLAEETGLILPLGQWVLDAACAQLATWALQPHSASMTLAVNVSARQFRHPEFVAQVQATLARSRANPKLLKLELTESLLVDNVQDIIDKMTALKLQGVNFSMDDFGTGYSSLSLLKRLPLDQLKIDQSFVRDVLTDPNDAAIVRTIVALGQSLGLAVIAEGVETDAQRDFLANNGCHAYQGFHFGKPAPIREFTDFIDGLGAWPG